MDNKSSLDLLYSFARDRYTDACLAAGVPVELRYGAHVQAALPANDTYWARIVRNVVSEEQETLRNGDNVRRFVSIGLLYVQMFAPVTDSKALFNLAQISEDVRTAFRRYQSDDMEFTNPWINDNIAPEPSWLRANIVINYAYRQFTT